MPIEIRPVTVDQMLPIMGALMREHWQETEAWIKGEGPVPAVEIYHAMESTGVLIVLGAFDGDTIVGYVTAIVSPHPHYSFLVGQHDLLYLDPAYRRGRTGLRLMLEIETMVKARGARWMAWTAKPGSPFDALLSRRGYVPEETIYKRPL